MRRFPEDDSKGINREHGEDDPVGTETVAAPATVSGLSIISGMASDWPSLKGPWPCHCGYRGKADVTTDIRKPGDLPSITIQSTGRGCPDKEQI
ncbi:hypothetical protein GCM10007919_51100 [Rhizobium indigoferae]|nr:hypothetical protein GCM10007919_51100 [Rhizobium indigoferae]